MAEIKNDFLKILTEFDTINFHTPLNTEAEKFVTRYISELFDVLEKHCGNGLLVSGIQGAALNESRRFSLSFIPSIGKTASHLAYFTNGSAIQDAGVIIAANDRPTFVYNYSEETKGGLKAILVSLGATVIQVVEQI